MTIYIDNLEALKQALKKQEENEQALKRRFKK